MKISIIGSGTWGIALGNLLAKKRDQVTMFCHFEEERKRYDTTRLHPRFPGIKIDKSIKFTGDLQESLDNAEMVVYATPSPYFRNTVKQSYPYLKGDPILVTVSKGLEDESFLTMSEILEEETHNQYKVVCLTGPTHAEEVMERLPTCCVACGHDKNAREKVREVFSNSFFRVYTNDDIYGSEISAALKNIIALASGMAEGLGYGDNARAALITRGLYEIQKLGVKLGSKPSTFYGLAGLGDLVVTATSKHSRNHEAGLYLGQGYSVEETKARVGMAIEGLNALKAAYHLSLKTKTEMPITQAIYKIIYEDLPPSEAVNHLFSRSLKNE